jgi:PRTRC genetic system ThiF family protein
MLQERVAVHLVGCGGNGSQMLTGLARLHCAMLALGHPGGLEVTVWDPDKVSESNVGRQLFSRADIGRHKAICLVERVNLYYGFNWQARPARYSVQTSQRANVDLLITCVDTAKDRRDIALQMQHRAWLAPRYWLDLGNMEFTGHAILGVPEQTQHLHFGVTTSGAIARGQGKEEMVPLARLPIVTEVYPDLLDETILEDNTPSCSLAEALRSQGLFINQAVATWALTILERLFRFGRIEHHGYLINLESGRVNPLPVPSVIPERVKEAQS